VGRCEKLIQRAERNPGGLRFPEAKRLAECLGFTLERMRGSHHVYVRAGRERPVVLTPDRNGMAKGYQVRQLLTGTD